jgi:hypothetical protein
MQTTAVRDRGLVANFHRPSASGARAGIIVLGGAGGGLRSANAVGSVLAELGYAALGLAYFGTENLPSRLEEIPLEYLKRAIDWMQSQPSVEPSKIAFLGTSKGGEGALLASAVYREVRAVIAYSPSHVAFQGANATWLKPKMPKSSWTLDGKPIPFVPLRVEGHKIDRYGFYLGLYLSSLQDRQAVKRAAIPIERINGPILLISGTDDAIWPSSAMCEEAIERLRRCHFTFPFRHLKYEGAGHLLAGPRRLQAARLRGPQKVRLGGTECANAVAGNKAWKEVLDFLETNLS